MKEEKKKTPQQAIAEEYSGKTIDNIIAQMEARKKEVDNAH